MKDSLIVIGLQYGDEGKGRIVDYLGSKFDGVVRYNGANNAGHTIVINSLKFTLSQLPCSVFNNNDLLIAQGCSINPKVLINEIKSLESLNIQVKLKIDYRCHIIMPYHQISPNIVEPNYKICEGWSEDISKIRDLNKLPKNCRKYISFIEEELAVPITLISVDAERESIIEV